MVLISTIFMFVVFTAFGVWLSIEVACAVDDEYQISKKILWFALYSVPFLAIGSLMFFACPSWLFLSWVADTIAGIAITAIMLWRFNHETPEKTR